MSRSSSAVLGAMVGALAAWSMAPGSFDDPDTRRPIPDDDPPPPPQPDLRIAAIRADTAVRKAANHRKRYNLPPLAPAEEAAIRSRFSA